jgi:hypothetical protein
VYVSVEEGTSGVLRCGGVHPGRHEGGVVVVEREQRGRVGAVRHLHDGVDREAGQDRPVGCRAQFGGGRDPLHRYDHLSRGPRHGGHRRIARARVDADVAQAVRAVRVQYRHVERQRPAGDQLRSAERVVDDPQRVVAHFQQVRADQAADRQERQAAGGGAEPGEQGRLRQFRDGDRAPLDTAAEGAAQPEVLHRHRGERARGQAARGGEPVHGDAAAQRHRVQVPAARPDELAYERHRRALRRAALQADHVPVVDQRGRLGR